MWYFLALYGVMNVVTFALYGIDKLSAIRGGWRRSEAVLLLTAFLLGGVGAALAMLIFRHKTRKPLFKIVYVLAVLQAVAVTTACILVH